MLNGPCVSFDNLSLIRKSHLGKSIIFCSGAFDFTHVGHILFLEDCKKLGDILVVGVAHDAVIKKNKGSDRPFFNEHIRLKHVSSLRCVDYCFLDIPTDGYSLELFADIFLKLRPQKYVINRDAFDIPYRKRLAEEHGVELVIYDRWYPPEFGPISTTSILEKLTGNSEKRQ